jgi:hypothetical protein
MVSERYHEAKKYAYSLDRSYRRYENYHKALLANLYSEAIDANEFVRLAKVANVDLSQPDATSESPHRILWWNVDLPDYVLLAKDGGERNYWAFTRRSDQIMQQLAKAFDEGMQTPHVHHANSD